MSSAKADSSSEAQHSRTSEQALNVNREADPFTDGHVDKAKGTVVFKRYYHLFDKGELDHLVRQVPGVKIEGSFYDKSNWCTVFEKA